MDLALSRRLEAAEGFACREYAAARAKLDPESGATWVEIGGGWAVFDGVDSPVTQCFGLGLKEPLTADILDQVEAFFEERGAACDLEISPLAGVNALRLVCERGYKPIEIASVLCLAIAPPAPGLRDLEVPRRTGVLPYSVRIIQPEESDLWAQIAAEAWAAEIPGLRAFLEQSGRIFASRKQSVSFLAEYEGQPAATASLSLNDGLAMLAGAATIPAFRRRGLQSALLQARLQYAREHSCDLAMMVAEAGSGSQRNAQRQGFSIAYTRIKWRRAVETEALVQARPPACE